MTTHATLKTDVATWMSRTDLTSHTPTFITLAEAMIRDDVRVRDMETTADISFTSQSASLPTGYLSMKRAFVDATWHELRYYVPDEFHDHQYSTLAGTPEIYTIEGDSMLVAPAPASATVKVNYYKAYDALSADGDTNWVLTNHYGIYLYAALFQAKSFIEDPEAMKWKQMYEEEIGKMNMADWKSRISGSALQRAGHCP